MSEENEPVHERIADLAAGALLGRAVDLGCGRGPTLRALARHAPSAVLVGVDRSDDALRDLPRALASHRGPVLAVEADLRRDLPFADRSFDVVVSYNTLECVPDPLGLLREVYRVLRPGGRVVTAHVDFDSLTISGADRALDRRVCHAFADYQQGWMDHADGRMGREIPGLVALSPLRPLTVEPMLVWSSRLEGHAAQRIEDMRKTLLSAARRGRGEVPPADVDAWFQSLCTADDQGSFFFAELTVLVAAERAADDDGPAQADMDALMGGGRLLAG